MSTARQRRRQKEPETGANLSDLEIKHSIITVDGERYVITHDTGEMSFGADLGGGAAFAYRAHDVAELVQPESYADFCDSATALDDQDSDWDAVAVACAVRGWRLTLAGACTPALTDREYTLVRMAAEQSR